MALYLTLMMYVVLSVANCSYMGHIIYFWEVKVWGSLSLNGNRKIDSREGYRCYKNHKLDVVLQARDTTHIHQCKHRWPKHARPSICLELPSCWDWSSFLTVNLYTIILSPILTRHLMLWVAKCLCARTLSPLLLLVLCPHVWAKNLKAKWVRTSFPGLSALQTQPGSYGICVKISIFLKYTRNCLGTFFFLLGTQWKQQMRV